MTGTEWNWVGKSQSQGAHERFFLIFIQGEEITKSVMRKFHSRSWTIVEWMTGLGDCDWDEAVLRDERSWTLMLKYMYKMFLLTKSMVMNALFTVMLKHLWSGWYHENPARTGQRAEVIVKPCLFGQDAFLVNRRSLVKSSVAWPWLFETTDTRRHAKSRMTNSQTSLEMDVLVSELFRAFSWAFSWAFMKKTMKSVARECLFMRLDNEIYVHDGSSWTVFLKYMYMIYHDI